MLPNFFIVGAPKAGTTWLYSVLLNHPQVYMSSNKEPRFFASRQGQLPHFAGPGDHLWLKTMVVNRDEYEDLFTSAGTATAVGEASTDYLYQSETVAPQIRERIPDAKIIVLLRKPADRAFSNWLQLRLYGFEKLSFRCSIDAEGERIQNNWAWWWHYVQRGFYERQLEPFWDNFPADRMLILLYEDLSADPVLFVNQVTQFLGLSPFPAELVDKGRVLESKVPKSDIASTARKLLLRRLIDPAPLPRGVRTRLTKEVDRITLHRPTIAQEDAHYLTSLYAQSVENLGKRLGRDLSSWNSSNACLLPDT